MKRLVFRNLFYTFYRNGAFDMKKSLVCLLLVLITAISVCSVAFAASEDLASDAALLEKIAAQEAIRTAQEIPAMIKTLESVKPQPITCEAIWYDEEGDQIEDPDLLKQLEKAEPPQMVCETILYDETGNHITDSSLLTLLENAEPPQMVCETIWYDDCGNRIDDMELISLLSSGMAKRVPVTQPCCNYPSLVTSCSEQHCYVPPKPAFCICYRTEVVACRNCRTIISRTPAAEYSHMHE